MKTKRVYKSKSILDRFWSYVDIKNDDECWMIKKTKSKYSRFWIPTNPPTHKGQNISGHVFSWILANKKDVPKGMVIMHKCDTPFCVNPNHLELGTPKENINDMVRKGRNPKMKEHYKHIQLTREQVLQIRADLKVLTGREIARKYNILPSTVTRIKKGDGYRWVEEEI